ncbi:MAG: cation-efflux pump [Actinobacteria bacterium]|nr:MAG: cation-efflux pump [Actinomycetota bacterium]
MTPQRRTALVSVLAACALIALKVAAGIPSHSLGLLSEAAHSGIDLVAALLTFFAVGVAGRPADPSHAYGHGKAEHLAALAEAATLVVVAVFIMWRAISHLAGMTPTSVHAVWYALLALAIVICVDFSRMLVSLRAGRRYGSAALQANAVHFASDLAGSVAVLGGLLGVRAGWKEADSAAALFVALLVLAAAARLMRRNVDVLMDRVPSEAHAIASRAIRGLEPLVQLRRLRMRQAGGRQFADVVIGVPPGAAVGQGHAAADAVEAAVHEALPQSDVVVHVEPQEDEAALRERALAAAQHVPQVREIHNLSVLRTEDGAQVSLHLKLPADLPLEDAHAAASEVEREITESVPEVTSVRTHLEPLAEPARGTTVERDTGFVEEIVRDATGAAPRELRFLETEEGLVAFVTLGLDPATKLADAHRRASEVEERIRQERPEIADVIVHTEP